MVNAEPAPSLARKPRRLRSALRLLVSLGILIAIFFLLDWSELYQVAIKANLWLFFVALLVWWLDRVLMTYKWRLLLRVSEVHVPFMTVLQVYSAAPLVGMVIPLPVSQMGFRLYSLARQGAKVSNVLASMVVERLIAFFALLILASISFGIGLHLLGSRWPRLSGAVPLVATAGALAFIVVILAVALNRGWVERALRRIGRSSVPSTSHEFFTQLALFRHHTNTVMIVAAWTFLEQMAPILSNLVVVWALHVDASPLELVAIVPLVVLSGRLPISFQGIGVQEGVYVGLLSLIGVSAAEALLLSGTLRIVSIVGALPWWLHHTFVLRAGRPDALSGQTPRTEHETPQ